VPGFLKKKLFVDKFLFSKKLPYALWRTASGARRLKLLAARPESPEAPDRIEQHSRNGP